MTHEQIRLELEVTRQRLGWTYKELARRVALMPDNTRGILQGWIEPKLGTLLRLCKCLGLELTIRFGLDSDK